MEDIRVLLIEDNPADARLIREMLAYEKDVSFNLEWKDNLTEGLKRLAGGRVDIVLLDLMLPDSFGRLYTFTTAQAQAPEVPIVILTSFKDDDFAINAISMGAQDYLIKGQVDSNQLVHTIRYAIWRKQILKNHVSRFKKADNLKNLFTNMTRQDILNLADVIKTTAELGLGEAKGEGVRNALLKIRSNTDMLIGMIKTASTYAMLVESIEKLERRRLDLNMIIRKVADSFKPELEKKNIKLEYQVKSDCSAMVNPMIEDAFSNLISNAIKYSPESSKIEAGIIKESKHWKIYVKDWGYGIREADRELLFKRFQRVDEKGVMNTEPGLAIVNRIAELHGGRVGVEDNPEGGCLFYVEIPEMTD
ncbi:hybrid sensor histidine kinase/response regulator [Candidatus Methanoperedens nitratireducens]|uniref:Putative Histidine kinase n=1 Tax=Candidatus Methanoperedens nitratireducens TaxID=1392998 RepID=A0A284VLY6_9EURY|nr:hybrid sensor histidine kinase/response regulator [Candidatus Methanoperedens nitroreducens]SNQ60223.1 putative Histidine kinase [Candidatus Methanoperedens nitroreducens]